MGCGTAILAILAEMKGAQPIDAIDIDNWCYLNSIENAERNNCKHISVYEGDASLLKGKKYDVIIVGGGPGGATAAYNLAKEGISVCIIEKDSFPRNKVCGGGLCAHIRKFDYIDDIFFETVSTAATVYSPSQKHVAEYSPKKT